MHQFTDNAGKTWGITLTIQSVKEIRDICKVDLVADDIGEMLKQLSDPVLLIDVLFVCVRHQADSAGVSPEEFGRSFVGDTLEVASAAFIDELLDFFPRRRRLMLGPIIKQAREQATADEEKIKEIVGEISTGLPGPSE